jgi:hypothetical protein
MHGRQVRSRRASATLLLALAIALPLGSAKAIVGPNWGLEDVPVERLIKNLEALTKDDPKNMQVRFNLARAHSMAYAVRTDTVGVHKNSEKAEGLFGFGPQNPSIVTPPQDKAELKIAREHLATAIEQYEEGLKLAPDNLAGRLGYAWCIEQSGQTAKAIEEYREVIKAAWVTDKDLKYGPMYGETITVEAAGYLIRLLDADKDKKEINTLQERIKQMRAVRRPISPIVIPLRDRLTASDLEDHSGDVAFDADGSGLRKRWTWISKDAGWLVNDPHHTGKITSALQFFGNVTFWMFWENGYHALASLDDDRDGKLAGKELEGLAIWQDLNGDGVSDRGEVKPLAEWGVVAISCGYVKDMTHPDRIAYSPRGVFFRDGFHRPTYDIILHPAITSVD